ncbi:MAG: biosynthetic-type acetolactate synthase large subunit [Betaproteobacteria bacterium]|nr:biosynthetic-type acetolactate synthase large subunit [Betaproteobacteria bacterium]
MTLTGAEILIRCLQNEKAEYVFGYPGGAVLYLYDALFQQDDIRHVLVRHEQAAVHAADGYARSTGKTGIALVTSGPGATNAVTGIATAYYDSIPIVVISGQVATAYIGQDAFQEVDTVGVTRPCVKHNFLVRDVRDLALTLKKAFYLARSGRPGPVVVDIPKDVSIARCEFDEKEFSKEISMRSYNPVIRGHQGQIKKAAQMLLEARRPMIYAGGGIVLADSAEGLTHLARLLGAPVTTTLMGLGGFPASDHLYLGMPGMHGTFEANMAVHYSDVLLAIGTRFDDRVIGNIDHFYSEQRKIIHIDIDPASISKRVKVDIPIVGNVKDVLDQLIRQIESSPPPVEGLTAEWWAQVEEWRARRCLAYKPSSETIKPQFVIQKLWEITEGKAFITSDVGQHQMWAAQYYRFDQPRRWLNSGGLGTMGVGLPYAMGAQLAYPGTPVVCVSGEGSIQMNIQELSTCRQFRLPIKICLLNNRYLGMVRQWQQMFHGQRYSGSYMDSLPDFVKLAEAYGHVGIRVDKPSDVESALREAFTTHKNELVFLDFQVDRSENVYPMIPGGKGLTEMVLPSEEP